MTAGSKKSSLDARGSARASRMDTLAVRGGESKEHGYHAVTMPIVCSATYAFSDTAEIRAHFAGQLEREEYGRYGNPTVHMAERKLAALEGADDAVLFPSGMSAITTLLLALLSPGDHVVLTADCYRRTRQFVTTTLHRYGVQHTLVDPADYGAMEAAVLGSSKTRLLISEAPTNPYLRIADIARMAAITRASPRAKLLIDSTLASPVNMRPLQLGADLVAHSCSKYLGGHNDLLAGAICGRAPLMSALRDARGLFGGMPDPHGAYLLIRGLKTLSVRMRQHNESGAKVARYLAQHAAVEHVYYPGLESDPDHEVAKRQCAGYGGMVSFRVRGHGDDLERTAAFIDACSLATIGPSMGGVETLIEQPAIMSFSGLSREQRQAVGIHDNLVRLSVGLEDVDELIEDLDRALAESRRVARVEVGERAPIVDGQA
ncbi:MAG: Cystathionine gamma-synthase [Myxococcaceae bacterium]|nr:Cystathionine gamma-synthase [Myxococcaceae bacterium]